MSFKWSKCIRLFCQSFWFCHQVFIGQLSVIRRKFNGRLNTPNQGRKKGECFILILTADAQPSKSVPEMADDVVALTEFNLDLIGVSPIGDDESPSEEFSKSFSGQVAFDFGYISNRKFGTARIRGDYPRIPPRRRLEAIPMSVFEALQTKLECWQKQYWKQDMIRWKELIHVTTIFGYANISPFFSYDTPQFDIGLQFILWIWYIDDVIEEGIKNNLSLDINQAIEQFMYIFEGRKRKLLCAGEFPHFESFYDSIWDIVNALAGVVPDYRTLCGPFKITLQKFLESSCWYSIEAVDRRYSEETFKYWRRKNGFYAGIAEFIFLLHGVSMPESIRHSSTFGRILEITNSCGGSINDLLGLQKELRKGEIDNFVVFKIFEKNVPVHAAVQEVCVSLKDDLSDLLLLREVIFRECSNHPALILFIDIVETIIDGFGIVHANSKRYMTSGQITMT